jgi:hypothetical protein
MGAMRRFLLGGRIRGAERSRAGHRQIAEGERHLADFVSSRRGVEAYVEPQTTVTATTVMLIAADGEWTRRRVVDTRAARALAERLGIPVYDVNAVGYPQRMREWNRRQSEERKRDQGGE